MRHGQHWARGGTAVWGENGVLEHVEYLPDEAHRILMVGAGSQGTLGPMLINSGLFGSLSRGCYALWGIDTAVGAGVLRPLER